MAAKRSVQLPGQGHILLGDPTLGVGDKSESDCPPADVDIGMMIGALGQIGDLPHRLNARQE